MQDQIDIMATVTHWQQRLHSKGQRSPLACGVPGSRDQSDSSQIRHGAPRRTCSAPALLTRIGCPYHGQDGRRGESVRAPARTIASQLQSRPHTFTVLRHDCPPLRGGQSWNIAVDWTLLLLRPRPGGRTPQRTACNPGRVGTHRGPGRERSAERHGPPAGDLGTRARAVSGPRTMYRTDTST